MTAPSENQTPSGEPTIITKMAVKTLECKPANRAEDGNPLALCRIFGIATDVKSGENKDGTMYEALLGNFQGVNLENKKVFRSAKLFLPSGIHESVTGAVKEQSKRDDFQGVRFALEISSVKASNPIGYSYQAKNLIPATAIDPLGEMNKAIEAHLARQLEAPKTEMAKGSKK